MMNENAKRVYEYLMSGPQDFDMSDLSHCVLSTASELGCTYFDKALGWTQTEEVYTWLGLTPDQITKLCLEYTDDEKGAKAAKNRAKMLKEMCGE